LSNKSHKILLVGSPSGLYGGISRYLDLIKKSIKSDKCKFVHFEVGSPGNKNVSNSIKNFIWQLLNFFYALTKKDYSLVYIHTASWRSFWRYSIYIFISKLIGKTVVLHIHGAEFIKFYNQSSFVGKYWIRTTLRFPKRLIVLSKSWFNFFSSLNVSKDIKIIAPTTDIHERIKDYKKNNEHIKYKNFSVLYFGGIDRRKGLIELVRSIILIRKKYNIDFIIAGAKVKDEIKLFNLLNKHKEYFSFYTNVSEKKKLELFMRSHAYVLPSHAEGLPVTLIEAMECGLPIVTTKVGGIPDFFNEPDNGFLINPRDIKSLSESLIKLYSNKDLIDICQK